MTPLQRKQFQIAEQEQFAANYTKMAEMQRKAGRRKTAQAVFDYRRMSEGWRRLSKCLGLCVMAQQTEFLGKGSNIFPYRLPFLV